MLHWIQSYCCLQLVVYSYHWHVVHHKSHRRQSFKATIGAEEPAVQSFTSVSNVTPSAGVTLAGNIFFFCFYQISCHSILIWKIMYYITGPVIRYHPFPTPYYVWDAAKCKFEKCPRFPHLTVGGKYCDITVGPVSRKHADGSKYQIAMWYFHIFNNFDTLIKMISDSECFAFEWHKSDFQVCSQWSVLLTRFKLNWGIDD